MPMPPPPQGFMGLPDFGDIVGQITKVLPPEVGAAIASTVAKILDPNDPTIDIGSPQPPGTPPIPVTPGTDPMVAAMRALDAAISALNILTKLDFIIPGKYQDLFTKLQGALQTIRGWLD